MSASLLLQRGSTAPEGGEMATERQIDKASLVRSDGVEVAGIRARIQVSTDRSGRVTWRGTIWPLTEGDGEAMARANDRGAYILRLPSGSQSSMFISDRHSQSHLTESGQRTMIFERAVVIGSGDCPTES